MAQSSGTAATSVWNRRFLLLGSISVSFGLSTEIVFTIFPLYLAYLGFHLAEIGIISGTYTFCILIMRLSSGYLIDLYGRRSMALTGLACFVLGLIGYVCFPLPLVTVLLRLLQGIGMSVATVTFSTMAADLLPSERFAEGIGYFGLFSTIGSMFGSIFGLYLWENYPSARLFLLVGIFSGLAWLLTTRMNYEQGQEMKHRVHPEKIPLTNGMLGLFDAFFEKTALLPGMIMLLYAFPMGGLMTFLFPFATSLGVSGLTAIYATQAACLLFSRLQAAALAKRFGVKNTLTAGMLITTTALLLMAFATNKTILLLAAGFYGIGGGLCFPLLNIMAVEKAPSQRRGKANSTYMAASDLGASLGAFTLGFAATYIGYRGVFFFCCLVLLFDLLLMRFKLEQRQAKLL
ncbi:MAG: MFS transporter [Candidatus Riflebacteria bacterium]|nr:MFS transporter [Candidatus Riflebacteria bacterium]